MDGRDICPNGFVRIRYFLKYASTNTTLSTYTIVFTTRDGADAPQILQMIFEGYPVRMSYYFGTGSFILLGPFPNLKMGQGFDFQINCGVHSLEFFINDEKVHSYSEVHTEFSNPIITKISADAPVSSTHCMITNMRFSYCK